MRSLTLYAALILFLSSLAFAGPKARVLKGACPFEGCQFGKWKAKSAIKLYDKPFGQSVVATLRQGEQVEAVTGEEHVNPVKIEVIYPHGRFKKGDVIETDQEYAECGLGYWLNGKAAEGENCIDMS